MRKVGDCGSIAVQQWIDGRAKDIGAVEGSDRGACSNTPIPTLLFLRTQVVREAKLPAAFHTHIHPHGSWLAGWLH